MDTITTGALVAAGRALAKMVSTLDTKKATATSSEQYAVRKKFRDAAAYLRAASYTKEERDRAMKPYQLAYDPKHRTR
jgi:hypothetical protein